MAGMSIIVCLPSSAAGKVDEAVAEAMTPFARDGVGAVERDAWDCFRICGGTVGLPVLADYEDDARLITDRPRWDGTLEPSLPGMCAGGPRGLIDFRDALRAKAAEHAGRVWDRWREVASCHPAADDESVFFYRHLAAAGTRASYETSQEAADYRAQPAVRAWAEVAPTMARPDIADHFSFGWNAVGIGQRSREEYVATYEFSLLPSRNVLTPGGWWYELDEAPLHGACHSRAECVHEPDVGEGHRGVQSYLLALPADTLLVNVRCHV
ncbi:hypothetical protein [Streptomyces sp. Ncost-T10-10d]|uniref:hypothetical protein n=1 Tax=Streptomyces sp. Ncost-T10-10d TaxID=1839774 RepID=UPI00210E024D|nr:hypothetical protein [Streptomyces sp. Ncost-T10-10d]